MDRHFNPDIDVAVKTHYRPTESNPTLNKFVFTYQVIIRNKGSNTVRLISPYNWTVTDANGKAHKVRGFGVSKEDPYIRPGESFSYESGTIINTPVGSMHGNCHMMDEFGDHLVTPVASCRLADPIQVH